MKELLQNRPVCSFPAYYCKDRTLFTRVYMAMSFIDEFSRMKTLAHTTLFCELFVTWNDRVSELVEFNAPPDTI